MESVAKLTGIRSECVCNWLKKKKKKTPITYLGINRQIKAPSPCCAAFWPAYFSLTERQMEHVGKNIRESNYRHAWFTGIISAYWCYQSKVCSDLVEAPATPFRSRWDSELWRKGKGKSRAWLICALPFGEMGGNADPRGCCWQRTRIHLAPALTCFTHWVLFFCLLRNMKPYSKWQLYSQSFKTSLNSAVFFFFELYHESLCKIIQEDCIVAAWCL